MTDPTFVDGAADMRVRPRDAYARLRVAILSGELEAGRSYSQAVLSRELEVGRTPLREAIRRLQTEGLLESELNRKIRVSPLDLTDLIQLYTVRITMESLATRLSVPRLTSDDLQQLTELLAEHTRAGEAGEVELMEETHQRFHELLTRHAGEKVHTAVIELADHAERYRRQYYKSRAISLAHFQLALPEHGAVLDAAERGDAETASTLVAQHLARIAVTLTASIDGGFDTSDIQSALRMVAS